MLASVFDGDLTRIKMLIEKQNADAQCRIAGIEALKVLYRYQMVKRPMLVDFLKPLLIDNKNESSPDVCSDLILLCIDFGLTELKHPVTKMISLLQKT